jgi:hypothetical protein
MPIKSSGKQPSKYPTRIPYCSYLVDFNQTLLGGQAYLKPSDAVIEVLHNQALNQVNNWMLDQAVIAV